MIQVIYVYLMPSISAVGVLGNVAVITILGQRKKFGGSPMFVYMRGMAVTDISYLLSCMQASLIFS